MTSPEADWLESNRLNWDDRVRVHAASTFYDLPGFRAGASTLRAFELDEVGDVTGKRLLHLQCHMGQDTLSWARRGADVTGLDFSEVALRQARELAADVGLADRARFVASDVYEAAAALNNEQFDIVYTGIGALVWLPDLPRWARVVSSLVTDGGTCYLAELHPITEVLDQEGRTVVRDYFEDGAVVFDYPHTYTDGPPLEITRTVQWNHQLGAVVSALAAAGLRIEFLHEHPVTMFRRYEVLERSAGGDYRFPPGQPRIPLMYSIRATKMG